MTSLPLGLRCRAALACFVIPPLVNTVSFARLVRHLGKRGTIDRRDIDDDSIAEWVTAKLHRLPDPWYPTCLRRSAVLYYLLRRAGRSVSMYLGVQRGEEQGLHAHAWLVLNGSPHLEPQDTHPDQYKIIAKFPDEDADQAVEPETSLEPMES